MVARVIRAGILALLFILRWCLLPACNATESTASESQLRAHGEGSSIKVYGRVGGQMAQLKATGKSMGDFGGISSGSIINDATGLRGRTPTLLSFMCSNEYPPIEHSRWRHVAEPYRETTLTASTAMIDELAPGDIFLWKIGDSQSIMLEGREVKHTFKTVGRQRVTLSHISVRTGVTRHLEGHVMVKYVRREIRQLVKTDREAFFEALETLYRVPTSEGIKIYGDDYKGIEFFVQMHLEGAGSKDCDHWHDDAGVMTHHVGMTLLFEQTLQVVNPAVAIPYWEYTIEGESDAELYGDSKIFAPDWFGEASPDNRWHTVDVGRFAYLPVMKDAIDYVHNAYGLLRAPWNLDPSPYLTRHNDTNGQAKMRMVDCGAYAASLESETLSEFNNWLNGGIHGPVHIMVGGEWDDPEERFIDHAGYSSMVVMITKFLWRKGYLRLPEKCSFPSSPVGKKWRQEASDYDSDCRASCPAELYESRGMTAYDVLMDVNALYWTGRFSGGVIKHIEEDDRFVVAGHEEDEAFQSAFWNKMLRSLCDPGHVGELLTASAPYDPLFWVIHPTAERVLNWRRIIARSGKPEYAFDEAWGYKHGFVVGETGVVCDWSTVEEDSDMPNCINGICGGHKALDILPFNVKINGEKRNMTNLEWLDFIYPTNGDLPYLYNEYRWDHCVEAGYDLGTLTH